MSFTRKEIVFVILFFAMVLLFYALYRLSVYHRIVRVFSPYSVLTSSWDRYKVQFINSDGRNLDHSQNDITTSEGQSYALLRSVWIDDKKTFDKVWYWTKNNLQRSDKLFGWKWGERQDRTYGFIENGGSNSASDADSDIALALILASRRWNDDSYKSQALPILNSIWNEETIEILGKRYLTAGNWATSQSAVQINPSYFTPYSWRIFAQVDPKHNWTSLLDPAYALLYESGSSPLDKGSSVGLPPDWLEIERNDGSLRASSVSNATTNYSYDAMRIPWRIELDYQWNHDVRDLNYLSSLNFLHKQYVNYGKLASVYLHNGQIEDPKESPAMYGSALGFFIQLYPKLAQSVYQKKVIFLYSNSENSFNHNLGYYDQNWLWFGTALYNHFLTDFGLSA